MENENKTKTGAKTKNKIDECRPSCFAGIYWVLFMLFVQALRVSCYHASVFDGLLFTL